MEATGRDVESNLRSQTPRGEEMETARILILLWKRKVLIMAITAVSTLAGVGIALLSKPVFYSQATIAMKETGKGGDASRLFAQFGGMGGMVASQLGLGNTNLEKMEVILKSHDLAETTILNHNLLPQLFPKHWNPKTGSWKTTDTSEIPEVWDGILVLKKKILVVNLDLKKSMIKVGMMMPDPTLAKKFVDHYLKELNDKIRSDVVSDAEANRSYLERQLNNTSDPVLIEKIHAMIAFEIEKTMLVSSQAFEILERPVVPVERSKPNRKMIVALAFLMGLAGSIIWIFIWNGIAALKKI